MFLNLNHQQLDVYKSSLEFVIECYKLTNLFPAEEKYSMTSQIRRAALSVHLNIAEGSSRRSGVERKRFYEISRGSLIEVDAALDVADHLSYLKNIDITVTGEKTIKCFKLLSGLIKAST